MIGQQGAGVTVTAVVFPRCECGQPYPAHYPEGCTGYRPSRPMQDLGTVGYNPRPGLQGLRRALAMLMFRIEAVLQTVARRLRERREAM